MTRRAHIIGQRGGSDTEPKYTIIDAGHLGEDAGMVPAKHGLSKSDAITWLVREGASYHEAIGKLAEADQNGESELSLPIRLGPRTVRAWFDTVFSPLISELRTEISLLDQRNWTFNFRTGTLEYVKPIRSYLEPSNRPNLDQIVALDTEIGVSIEHHDKHVRGLSPAVAGLHANVKDHAQLISLLDALTKPPALAEVGYDSPEMIFGAYPLEDRYAIVAQYVVNHSWGLPPWLPTARLWNKHRETFIKVLEQPELRDLAKNADAIGGGLKEKSGLLLQALERKRLELSLEYDLPYSAASSGLPAA